MINKFSKICLFLSLLMIFSLFCGCGKTEPEVPVIPDIEFPSVPEVPAEPEKVSVLDQITVYTFGDGETYSVGNNLSLNNNGKLQKIDKRYSYSEFFYNEDSSLYEILKTDPDDGSVGYERWYYTDGLVSEGDVDPNDGFHSLKKIDVEKTFDSEGRVIELIQNVEYTDAEDGSIDYGVIVYEIGYDGNGKVSTLKYYSDGKLDHRSVLEYDEFGNLTLYSNTDPSTGNEYLRVELSYKLVDESGFEIPETDSFTEFCNFLLSLNTIL